jgi:hypothetical protein
MAAQASRGGKVTGVRSALIVACDGYQDAGLGQLRAPASDARALAGVLQDPAIGGFDVRTLLNAPAYEVALAVEEFFADRVADDLLLLHLSCHGVKDEDGELYFAMANTALRRLAATGVAAEFVNRRMNRSRSRRVVLLLDCCYAGAFERGMTARAGAGVGIESQFGGRGRAVITASSAMEYAFEGDELADTNELAPSVFTSALVEGLETGDADRDQDGVVSLDELYDYIYDKVRATTPNQTPGKWAFGVQGELVIARRAQPVTQPAPLPPEVQEAIDSPLAVVRGAAVQELARLLQGKHAGRVLAARQALEELTGDDSRSVAAAAAAALSDLIVPAQAGAGPPQPAVPAAPAPVIGQPEQAKHEDPPSSVGSAIEPTDAQVEPDPEPHAESDLEPHAEPDPEPHAESDLEPHAESDLEPHAEPDLVPRAGSDLEPQAAEPEPRPAEQQLPPATEIAQSALPSILKDPDPATHNRGNGLLVAAGFVAIVGAVILFLSIFPQFLGGYPLSAKSANTWQNVIEAVAAAVAGFCLVAPRTRELIGPGLLFGAIATAPSGIVYDLIVGHAFPPIGPGLWLNVVGCVILTVAAGMVLRALVRQRVVHAGRRIPAAVLPWLVVLVGCAGAVLLVVEVLNRDIIAGTSAKAAGTDLFALYWTATMALLLPAVAVVTSPRKFSVALLGGWIATGIAEDVFYTGADNSVFALTLLALLALTIAIAATARRSSAAPTTGTTSGLA